MIVPATLFSLLKYHSLWYAVNLLAAGGFVSWAGQSDAFLAQFHCRDFSPRSASTPSPRCWSGFSTARCCPCSRASRFLRPAFIAPLLWTGMLYSVLGHRQPDPQSAHRLVLVHAFADRLRTGLRLRRQSAGQGAHTAVSGAAVRRSRRTPYRRAQPDDIGDEETITNERHRAPPAQACCRHVSVRCLQRMRRICPASRPGPRGAAPRQVLDFHTLYRQNCAGCHGENGRNGAAISLANPVYLAVAGDRPSAQVTAKGVPGTLMPPFAESCRRHADRPADRCTRRRAWCTAVGPPASSPERQTLPPYARTFNRRSAERARRPMPLLCARCHGADGKGVHPPTVRQRPRVSLGIHRRPVVPRARQRSGPAQHHHRRRIPTKACPIGAPTSPAARSDRRRRSPTSSPGSPRIAPPAVNRCQFHTPTDRCRIEGEPMTTNDIPTEPQPRKPAAATPIRELTAPRTPAALFSSSSRLLLNGAVGAVLAVPIVGYLLGPALKKRLELQLVDLARRRQRFPRGRNPPRRLSQSRHHRFGDGAHRQRRLLGPPHRTANSSRSSPSTARISAARSAGSRNRSSSCAHATAAPTTKTAPAPPARRSAASSSTNTQSSTTT